MMKFIAAIAATLLLPLLAWAQDITLPARINIEKGRIALVTATTKGQEIRWINPSPNLDLLEFEGGRKIVISSPFDGEYPIYAYTAIDGKPSDAAKCVVQVGQKNPNPPGPTPPPPGPTPPNPPDPLVQEMKDLINADTAQLDLKWRQAANLVAIYKKAAELTATNKYSTNQDFHTAIDSLALSMNIDKSGLVALRKKVAEKYKTILGNDPSTPLTDEKRKAASDLFMQVAKAIEGALK